MNQSNPNMIPTYSNAEQDNSFKIDLMNPTSHASPYYQYLTKELRSAKIRSGDMDKFDEIFKKTLELCHIYLLMELPELAHMEWSVFLGRLNITVSEEAFMIMRATASNVQHQQTIIQKDQQKK